MCRQMNRSSTTQNPSAIYRHQYIKKANSREIWIIYTKQRQVKDIVFASPCVICSDPCCHHSACPHNTDSHVQQRGADLSHVSGWVLMVAFIFELMKSATVMWWNECFVHQLPPSTEIDGACNWWPLCVIAKINTHCCRHGRSMSCTKQARGREEFMSHHIRQQHAVTIFMTSSAAFAAFFITWLHVS